MRSIHKTLFLALVMAFLVACSDKKEKAEEKEKIEAISLSNMDTVVHPGDDFFRFVNGQWLKNTEIPAEESNWGSFSELLKNNQDVLMKVIKQASSDSTAKEESEAVKVANFYKTGMDSALVESTGMKPLEPYFKQINDVKNLNQLQEVVTNINRVGAFPFYSLFIYQDLKNSNYKQSYLYQGGLGLPDRDYYLLDNDKFRDYRAKYKQHITNMFKLLGDEEKMAIQKADKILQIETELAKNSRSRVELRDNEKNYNKMSLDAATKLTPSFDWKTYYKAIGASTDSVIVGQPEFFKAMQKVLQANSIEDLKTYTKWHFLQNAAPYMHHALAQENFEFRGKVLAGTEKMQPRWKRVLNATDAALGEALGKLYVAEVFPPEAKAQAQELVDNIKKAFAVRIKQLDWMTDSTKQMALTKLDAIKVKIGYPDKWKDYSGLQVGTSSYVENVFNANEFEFEHEVSKIGKPKDPTEWGMTPPTVNAYYSPTNNEIAFPAGILQPPFYNYKADAAVNYGGIGAVIGHEISHGFDDQGSQYDAQGNLKNWWSKEDREKFEARSKGLIEQFNSYKVLDSVPVNGSLTIGENIADLGGLAVAYDALQLHLKEHGNPGKIDGYSPEQRFFMSWAQIWRRKYRDEELRNRIITDPHSPSEYRANGPLTNINEWYSAFNISNNNKLYRADSVRIKIW